MQSPNRRRSIILLVAVLLPSTALVGIAARMIRQEHELADRRALQARRSAVAQAGRELELAIDRIPVGAPADSVVVLAAGVRNGSFGLPWESPHAARVSTDSLLIAGTTAELRGDHTAADAFYARTGRESSDSLLPTLALLFRARNAARAGHDQQARAWYGQLLAMPLTVRDEEGMPFALYAADWLSSHGLPIARIRQQLIKAGALSNQPHSRIALYAMRSYFSGSDSTEIEKHLSDAERLAAVRRDYPALLATAQQQDRAVWLAYGPEPWLVRADTARIVVVRPKPLLTRSGVLIAKDAQGGGEPLGAAFPGVYAAPTSAALGEPGKSGPNLLLAILLLTIGLTVLSGLMVWRDVRREVDMAELRTQFVSSVSHELKTPLTAIRMYAEMLRMGMVPDPAKGNEFVETIVHESERLTRLINNVLDFSRIERGERIYRREPIMLSELAAQIERAMSYLSQQDGFKLRITVEPGLPTIEADRDALVQAILNLLSNAMKFSGSARDIELTFSAQPNGVAIRVTDHGRGISAAVRPHIFEKFYRSPDVRADGIPGTGIGLALVAHVAHGHGGDVVVDSEPGRGSTFSLTLPAAS